MAAQSNDPEYQAYLEAKRRAYREAGCAVASCLIRTKGMIDLPPEEYPNLVSSFDCVTIEGEESDWSRSQPNWRNLTCTLLVLLVGYVAERTISSPQNDALCWDSPLIRQGLELARRRVTLAYYCWDGEHREQPADPHTEQSARKYLVFMLDFAEKLYHSYSWYIDRVAEALLHRKTLSQEQVFNIIESIRETDAYLDTVATQSNVIWPWRRPDLQPNLYDLSYVEAQRKKVIDVAQGMLDGKVDIISGVRLLLALQHTVTRDDFDPDFMIFHAINSETEHLYPGKERELFAQDMLAEMDREIKEWEDFWRERALAGCQALITKFAHGKSI